MGIIRSRDSSMGIIKGCSSEMSVRWAKEAQEGRSCKLSCSQAGHKISSVVWLDKGESPVTACSRAGMT